MSPYEYSHLRARNKSKEPFYSQSPHWSDVEPIPLIEGPPQPPPSADDPRPPVQAPALATIAYSPRYLEAMSYLRAVMANNEFSERSLALTEDIIGQNPAHYTVWLFRMKCLREIWGVNTDTNTPPTEEDEAKIIAGINRELDWLEGISERNLKNYQIWHHRQSLLTHLPPSTPLPSTELPFLTHILSFDTKNYHVWTYRQWLCRRYATTLLPKPPSTSPELALLDALITTDPLNNSAWSHRYFVVFGHEELTALEGDEKLTRKEVLDKQMLKVDETVVEREVEYAQKWIRVAPQNASPWNYLRGTLRRAGRKGEGMRQLCEGFVREEGEDGVGELDFEGDGVRSSHAIEWLSEIYAEEGTEEGKEKARRCLKALGEKWDVIRRNYWEYRVKKL